ncbi:beta-ketoacyl-[acyl-carrier-protein] synthase II [Geovibrio thiophilus]|uniref:3-oxoacyl-[acyl-carrier-protein] synthase 2 n=1 Tax=Geovibrio thiophilus TaxID=139438 RepID=A0A3R5XYN4_9BACT|nr:beta-ketoacyl-[acyl-carrier-protein] synthase II [Geovibrio thiophilus]
MQLKRVVVTGLGAVSPLGNNVADSWNNLMSGVSGAGPITKFDASGFKTRFACEVKGFDTLSYFDAKEARRLDIFSHYSIAAADEAFRDANLNIAEFDKTRAGVIWSSSVGGMPTMDEQIIDYASHRGKPRFSPFLVPKIITNIASGLISIRFGLMGINFCPVSACASSTNAIADAFNYIRLGKADIIITGGAESAICDSSMGGFNAMKALSERNDAPEKASRPFDKDRDGFVMGEGAAGLVLEEYEHAKARGAKIYAEVLGAGFAADAYHLTATHPEGMGAYLGMKNALEDADLKAEDVDYLNAHATSTPTGDDSEIRSIIKLFGEKPKNLSISATKSMTGHLLGAAGAIEALICVMTIKDGVIPPTINTENLDDDTPQGLDIILGKARKKSVNVAMSNTFGFGGHCAIAVFGKLR